MSWGEATKRRCVRTSSWCSVLFPSLIAVFRLPYAPIEQLIDEIVHALRAGEHVAIHCRMGIGRSAMIAAAALVALGETPESAFARIEVARGLRVADVPEQRQWVEHYAIRQRTRETHHPRFEDTL